MSDYRFWKAALSSPRSIGTPALPIHENEPQVGYYRKRNKGGTDTPVAIWVSNDEMLAVDGVESDYRAVDPVKVWTYVARDPIAYDLYKAVYEGAPWPDAPPVVDKTHNLPADEVEALDMELQGEIELADAFLQQPVADQTAADKVATWAKRLGEMEKKFDAIREERKRPHLEAGRKIDAEFKPRIEKAAEYKTKLKRSLDKWLSEQAAAERARQAEAARAAAELQRQAEEAERAIESADINEPLDPEAVAEAERIVAAVAAAQEEAKARPVTAGRTGAKVKLRTYKVARIDDFDALYAALKTHPDMVAKAEELAQRAAAKGFPLAGMTIIEEERTV